METGFHCSFVLSRSELIIQSNFIYHSLQNWLNGCLGVSIQCEIREIWENWYCGTNEIYIYMHIYVCVVLYIHSYTLYVYITYVCIWLYTYAGWIMLMLLIYIEKILMIKRKSKKRKRKHVFIFLDNAAKFCWKFHLQKFNACKNLPFFLWELPISLHPAIPYECIPITDFKLIKYFNKIQENKQPPKKKNLKQLWKQFRVL